MNAALLSAAAQRQAIERFREAGALSRDTALPLNQLNLVSEGPVARLVEIDVVHQDEDEHAHVYWYDHGAALDYQDGQHGKLIIAFVMLLLLFGGIWATYRVLTTMG